MKEGKNVIFEEITFITQTEPNVFWKIKINKIA